MLLSRYSSSHNPDPTPSGRFQPVTDVGNGLSTPLSTCVKRNCHQYHVGMRSRRDPYDPDTWDDDPFERPTPYQPQRPTVPRHTAPTGGRNLRTRRVPFLKKAQQQRKGCRVSQSFLAGLSIYVLLLEIGFRLPEDSVISLFEYLNYLGLPRLLPALLGGWATYKLMQPAHDREWTWQVKVGCLLWSLPILLVTFAIFLTPYGEVQGLPLDEAPHIEEAIIIRANAIADQIAEARATAAAEQRVAQATAAAEREAARATATAEHQAAQATAAAEQRVAAAVKVREIEQHIHLGINAQRQAHGRSPLRHVDQLAAVARAHSDDMVNRNYFDHDTPEGLEPWDRISRSGYNCNSGAGENLAIELDEINPEDVAEQAVQSWMTSPGHRTNLLDWQYARTGVGASFGTYRGWPAWYLTQLFCF